MTQKEHLNYILVQYFDDETVEKFFKEFRRLTEEGQSLIPIYIDSYGGEAYSCLAMIDLIKTSKVPVATIATGKAMSCGAILLANGTPGYRFAGNLSTTMIHDISSMNFGKLEDLKADVAETQRLSKTIFNEMALHCGHTDKNYFLKMIEEKKFANWYLTAKEAKKHKVIDHIGIPTLTTNIQYILNV